ncbi:LolA family protein [Clostridium tetani]|uniref:LolA family protein n=1 Tax=Clostridium tetani TaxID=1513 RepID=UPI0024A81579|nr:outer membrane lipoprotein-sorting protein [Clostridium tetani]
MIKKKIMSILMVSLLGITALEGCEGRNSILPEEIVAHAMEVNDKNKTYYGERKTVIHEGDKVVEETTSKEWFDISKDKIRVRIENYKKGNESNFISTNDGNKVILYMKDQNKALTMKSIDSSNVPVRSLREETKQLLDIIKKSHEIKTLGEEKINGMDTYHLKAVPKEEKSILGEQELWIDKDDWFVVKSISQSANTKILSEYTKLDFSIKIKDSLFTQQIPKGVKIEKMEDLGPKSKKMDLKAVKDYLGSSFLYFNKESKIDIKDINLQQYGSKDIDDEIIMEYTKDNKPFCSISVRKDKDNIPEDAKMPGEKDINIRGQKGSVVEGNINIFLWAENNVRYSVILKDNSIKVEDFAKVLDKMSLYSQ